MNQRESYELSQELQKVDQQIRIQNLKDQAEKLSGAPVASWSSGKISADEAEQYWQQVIDYEAAPYSTYFDELQKCDFEFISPQDMDDNQLHDRLWLLIAKLGERQVFLYHTDHLSDRELYTLLYDKILREETKVIAPDCNRSAWHIDLVGTGSEEDLELYLKYYADDRDRDNWQSDFPEDPIPDHEDPPFDRDSLLPRWIY